MVDMGLLIIVAAVIGCVLSAAVIAGFFTTKVIGLDGDWVDPDPTPARRVAKEGDDRGRARRRHASRYEAFERMLGQKAPDGDGGAAEGAPRAAGEAGEEEVRERAKVLAAIALGESKSQAEREARLEREALEQAKADFERTQRKRAADVRRRERKAERRRRLEASFARLLAMAEGVGRAALALADSIAALARETCERARDLAVGAAHACARAALSLMGAIEAANSSVAERLVHTLSSPGSHGRVFAPAGTACGLGCLMALSGLVPMVGLIAGALGVVWLAMTCLAVALRGPGQAGQGEGKPQTGSQASPEINGETR